jgi:molybdopterin-containing oxidoreductase family iron-sulfur binding subunit
MSERRISRRQLVKGLAAGCAMIGVWRVGLTTRPSGQAQAAAAEAPQAHNGPLPGSAPAQAAAAEAPHARDVSLPASTQAAQKHSWVMLIDLEKCDGCGSCTRACNAMHFVPLDQEWIKIYELQDNPESGRYWFPRMCMQCENSPCTKVCPVGATYQREDGIVMMDQDKCIGCRFCIAACPYSSRYFNWAEPLHTAEETAQPYSTDWNYPHRKGVVEKCLFCPGMLKQGKLPACVSQCAMGALYFGDKLEDAVTNSKQETLRFSETVKEQGGYRFMEELNTQPRVYYLPPRRRLYSPPQPSH